MSRRWFGTDGIRGVANVELTAEIALSVGRAAAGVLRREGSGRLLLGRDTRLSGPLLQSAVAAGIASAGGDAILAGIIPTPGVARLVACLGLDGGVVISASHNPYEDNGIKLFGPGGDKLLDTQELELESRIEAGAHPVAEVGGVEELPGAAAQYVESLLDTLNVDVGPLRILLDCAHGATFEAAPLAFRAAGAEVEAVNVQPDGRNINAGCGSTNLAFLSSRVARGRYNLGLAFDGDGDRVLAVDSSGGIVDGDQILFLLASWLKEAGRLSKNTVVVTSMSNLGLHHALRERGIELEVTDVGDRHVLKRMQQVGAALGGEQSGHVIYLGAGATGDGIQTGLLLSSLVRESGLPLSQLAKAVKRFPQVIVNVRTANKGKLRAAQEIWEAVRQAQDALGEEGRVILRPSGTEPLVRVMVEASTEEMCSQTAERLARVVERALA